MLAPQDPAHVIVPDKYKADNNLERYCMVYSSLFSFCLLTDVLILHFISFLFLYYSFIIHAVLRWKFLFGIICFQEICREELFLPLSGLETCAWKGRPAALAGTPAGRRSAPGTQTPGNATRGGRLAPWTSRVENGRPPVASVRTNTLCHPPRPQTGRGHRVQNISHSAVCFPRVLFVEK